MCNSAEEFHVIKMINIPGELCSIYSYLNENEFKPLSEFKLYDAVYVARMARYKRHRLAAKISKLYVQTYGVCNSDGEYDLRSYAPELSHCDYNKKRIARNELIKKYNQAHVGLALSKCEGAMLACGEYMLCGIPVVSTSCRGGREEFFDPRYVKIVDDNPDAVAEGVVEMKAVNINPSMIRQETLEKIKLHRRRLCAYIQKIIQKNTKNNNVPTVEWLVDYYFNHPEGINRLYVNYRNLKKVLAKLQ